MLCAQPTPLLQQSVLMVQRTVNLDSQMLLHVSHAVLGAMLMQLGLQVAPCAQQALSALLVHSCSLLAIWVSTVLKAQSVLHSVQLLITARTLIPRPSANLDRTALLEAPPVLPAPQDITVLPQTRRPNVSQHVLPCWKHLTSRLPCWVLLLLGRHQGSVLTRLVLPCWKHLTDGLCCRLLLHHTYHTGSMSPWKVLRCKDRDSRAMPSWLLLP